MSDMISRHFERLRGQLSAAGLSQSAEWIQQHTTVRGQPFSFADHEYQLRVAEEQAPVVNVRKCSQIGLSELSVRLALSYCNLVPGFTTIYTLPTVAFARSFSTTRIDTVINGSPALKEATSAAVNNAEVKQFGESFLFVKGTHGTTQAISIPADCIVSDEYDFSNIETVSNYQSRLTHSKYRMVRKFSTPTVDGFGVSAEFDISAQNWLMCKCHHCNHQFIPDYYQHVRIPGFTGDCLSQITKRNVDRFRVDEAYLECPRCGKEPSLQPEHREWVVANPDEHRSAVGIQITPFDAPNIISLPFLIRASTAYHRKADFVNFNLGLPYTDSESAISKEEVRELFLPNPAWDFRYHFMGVDLGHENNIMIGGLTPEGELRVVHAEVVPIRMWEKRRAELYRQYKIVCEVSDQYPYQDMIWRLQGQQYGRNLFGAQFVERNTILPFEVHQKAADPQTSQPEVREARINRNRAFDALLDAIRTPGQVLFRDMEEKEEIIEQVTDMKRIRDISQGRLGIERNQFTWQKSSKANDHYHHALLYLWVATQLRGALTSSSAFVSPILGTIARKGKV